MTVQTDSSGRRSITVEVELPAAPQDVWQAVASGPGIASWFVPAEFEIRDGKPASATLTFGPGMDSVSQVTAWEPPHKWAAQSAGWAPGSPPILNEWNVEPRSAGGCTLRIVQSLVADSDRWDHQIEGAAAGWPGFLRTLRRYLTHFRGQRSATMQKMAPAAGDEAQAWQALLAALGLTGLSVGQRSTASADAPPLSGIAEYVAENPFDALLRLDKPAPGVCALGAVNFGGQSMVALNFYLYGDGAAETIAQQTPLWDAWFQTHFPTPTEPGTSS